VRAGHVADGLRRLTSCASGAQGHHTAARRQHPIDRRTGRSRIAGRTGAARPCEACSVELEPDTREDLNIIEVDREDVAALEGELRGAGLPYTVAKEDRYFGNVDVVSIVLDIAKAVSVLVPPLLAYLSSRKKTKVVINGVEIKVSDPLTEDDKERITKALNQ
jgi:hypothetical protein